MEDERNRGYCVEIIIFTDETETLCVLNGNVTIGGKHVRRIHIATVCMEKFYR